ncbi:MAG: PilZ domain-containing protein [Candidatus Omnitrophica bacterium]|nr:PilZ domain-containing protein [Candidatus Omnitrophota bacterium]
MDTHVPNDNRLFERFPARFPARFHDTDSAYGADVLLRDASGSGLRIATRQKLLLDDRLSLEVELPDGKDAVVLSGRVRWIHNTSPQLAEAGIELHKVSFMRMHRLVKYSIETAA